MLNQFLWLKHPPKMVVVEVVSLLVVTGVGKFCLLLVISVSLGILKNLELSWGRKGFLEAMQRMV